MMQSPSADGKSRIEARLCYLIDLYPSGYHGPSAAVSEIVGDELDGINGRDVITE